MFSNSKKEKIQFKYCISSFQEKYSFDKRQEQSHIIRSKYPDKLPIIVEKLKNISSHVSDIPKSKFLIPDDLVVSQLMCIIRKYIELSSADSIYLFANDTLISPSESLSNTYSKYKDNDGFLYIFYTTENTFGA
jgi:GABA(A) receptor-associated protein